MTHRKVGLWLIGAFGAIGATVALGVAALRRGLIDSVGLVTNLPMFAGLNLEDPATFVIGGHEMTEGDLAASALRVGGCRPAFASTLIESCRAELNQWSGQVQVGSRWDDEVNATLQRIQNDLCDFQKQNHLDQVIVVNLASTEPTPADQPAHGDVDFLKKCVAKNDRSVLPPSAWYAYAAISAGFAYVNFTPSCGASLPSLLSLAHQHRVPLAGQDGKTGETLVKTALAPMFAMRNLKVLSWVGYNILGNNDGRVLSDPNNRATKVKNKDRVVADILGYAPQTLTSIEYVESLDDWKTAWDHIHFQGFLGVPMAMQFSWQGCDSALAAPLVLDLARLVSYAQGVSEFGVLKHLAVFFKSPMGIAEHDLSRQWMLLQEYIRAHSQ